MGITTNDWSIEKKYLDRVIVQIKDNIEKSKNSEDFQRESMIRVQKDMWEDIKLAPSDVKDLENVVTAWQYQTELKNLANSFKFYVSRVKIFEKMLKSPYFGRIDFAENGDIEEEKFYIGIGNLQDDNYGFLVYDWRAPVSSMFYDYEIGSAAYNCPAGLIEGEIKLKRQYKIKDQEIKFMFDSNVKIDDEILQEILAKNTDDKMKTIITSIQREQNSIIRNEDYEVMIVQGTAGSGKTSIALHRIAYLLYRHRNTLNSKNIVILSPNEIFSDYISNVLPELGEENMYCTTFEEYVKNIIKTNAVFEDKYSQMEYILNFKDSNDYINRISNIKYKTSMDFLKMLKSYVENINKEGFGFKDIAFKNDVVITKEEINKLYSEEYYFLPCFARLEKIRGRISYLVEPIKAKRKKEIEEELTNSINKYMEGEFKEVAGERLNREFQRVYQEIYNMTSYNLFEIYKKIFIHKNIFSELNIKVPDNFERIKKITLKQFNENLYLYEDIIAITYLYSELNIKPSTDAIRHIVIDEVQDYSVVQIEIIKKIFSKCNMTLLGDIKQGINPYVNIDDLEDFTDIFNGKKVSTINLRKSYRSTKEIFEFCKSILEDKYETETVSRLGDLPEVYTFDSRNDTVIKIEAVVNYFKQNKKYQSVGIICRTMENSKILYKELSKKQLDIQLVHKEDSEYTKGVLVMPSYLAKGLEFDCVIVYCEGETDYSGENERKLFYTICSRALHELYIVCYKNMPKLIKGLDSFLYKGN